MAFKVCIQNPFTNCEQIYPIQQKKVRYLLDQLEGKENVQRVIIFGSSVTQHCHIGSDVDVYVELLEKERLFPELPPFELDVWTNFNVDDRLKLEILKKGVVVYGEDLVR